MELTICGRGAAKSVGCAIYEGAEFDSYNEFAMHFNKWSMTNKVRFVKSHSQTVDMANKSCSFALPLESRIKYRSLVLVCVRGGAPRRRENADNKIRKRSLKTGCPATLTLTANRNAGKLVIRKFINEHNHAHGNTQQAKKVKLSDGEQYFNAVDDDEEEDHQPSFLNLGTASPSFQVKPDLLDAVGSETSSRLTFPNIVRIQSLAQNDQARRSPFTSLPTLLPEALPDEGSLKRIEPTKVTVTAYSHHSSPGVESDEPPTTTTGPQHHPLSPDTGSEVSGPVRRPQAHWELPDERNREINHATTQPRKRSRDESKIDGEDYFCKDLALQLREMDEETRSRVKVQIMILTHQARFSSNSFAEESTVNQM